MTTSQETTKPLKGAFSFADILLCTVHGGVRSKAAEVSVDLLGSFERSEVNIVHLCSADGQQYPQDYGRAADESGGHWQTLNPQRLRNDLISFNAKGLCSN